VTEPPEANQYPIVVTKRQLPRDPLPLDPCRCLHLRCRCWFRRHPHWTLLLWVVIYVLAFALLASGTRYLARAGQ